MRYLIQKSRKQITADEALKLTQAALNLANTADKLASLDKNT